MPDGQPRTISRPEFLHGGSDSDFRGFIYDFLIVSTRMESIRDRIGSLLPLSGFQYHVLSVISELQQRGPVSVGLVAQTLHAGASYVTMESRKLERIGLVGRTVNPADKRGVLMELSPAGKEALNAIASRQCQINDALFDGLSREDFAAFRHVIAKMVENTSKALELADDYSRQSSRESTGQQAVLSPRKVGSRSGTRAGIK
jgi:MarR family transcriptional regulator, organic hydroperoxide resistance regulator